MCTRIDARKMVQILKSEPCPYSVISQFHSVFQSCMADFLLQLGIEAKRPDVLAVFLRDYTVHINSVASLAYTFPLLLPILRKKMETENNYNYSFIYRILYRILQQCKLTIHQLQCVLDCIGVIGGRFELDGVFTTREKNLIKFITSLGIKRTRRARIWIKRFVAYKLSDQSGTIGKRRMMAEYNNLFLKN